MDWIEILFVTLHAISFFLAIATYFILSHAGNLISYRLIRVTSIIIALISFLTLFPMIPNGVNPQLYPDYLCWMQGMTLHLGFIMAETQAFLLSLNIVCLVVLHKQLPAKFYVSFLFVFSLSCSAICLAIMFLTRAQLERVDIPFGVIPRGGYCFMSYPIYIRLAGYLIPYAAVSAPGLIFSFWTAVHLIRYKAMNAEKSLGVSVSMIYRVILFGGVYALATLMAFLPGMIKVINRWTEQGVRSVEDDTKLWYTEFCGAILGIAIFLCFGTGEYGNQAFKRYVRREKS